MSKMEKIISGEIYAIPLFLSEEKDEKSFSRNKFKDRGKEFVFCKVIKDMAGGGIIIEVLDIIGNLSQDQSSIVNAERLFKPVSISGSAISKKRWKKIHVQENYDKELHSKYSEISLIAGAGDHLSHWKGGQNMGWISEIEAKKYERWIVWESSDLEKRIIKALFEIKK